MEAGKATFSSNQTINDLVVAIFQSLQQKIFELFGFVMGSDDLLARKRLDVMKSTFLT